MNLTFLLPWTAISPSTQGRGTSGDSRAAAVETATAAVERFTPEAAEEETQTAVCVEIAVKVEIAGMPGRVMVETWGGVTAVPVDAAGTAGWDQAAAARRIRMASIISGRPGDA